MTGGIVAIGNRQKSDVEGGSYIPVLKCSDYLNSMLDSKVQGVQYRG